MVFTPPSSYEVRFASKDLGEEEDNPFESATERLPTGFDLRLFRRAAVDNGNGNYTYSFVEQKAEGREVIYTCTGAPGSFALRKGFRGAPLIEATWPREKGLQIQKKAQVGITLGGTSARSTFGDFCSRGSFGSRTITGNVGGKVFKVTEHLYDAYLEATHYEIRQKGNQDLLGSTKRFLKTDGRTDEEQYPIYLTPAGLRLQDTIIVMMAAIDQGKY